MGYGAADAFRALELRNVGTSQVKRSFASVALQVIMRGVFLSRPCQIGGCKRSHYHLLHGSVQPDAKDERAKTPREGAPALTHTSTSHQETATEAFSLRTVPVWLKGNDRNLKVNAMLDDGSN